MNVKPGDLAYLFNGCVNEGVVVEVLRCAGIDADEGQLWHCRSRSPICCTRKRSGSELMATEFACPDAWLRPINGVRVTDDISDEVIA
ncbi:hypothetical protein [Burkholderia pyrrocinia]|uniref:hypothetical protein n=1 Tax=Burkholderia pyrrocinia TaxID=60550 RepID=UPI00158D7C9E|nr:hypothetical protein [Burkholderia pyrrocinia]